jgi:hypothetical protein
MTHILLAQQYIGKEEKPNNSGFKDSKFEADMIKYGGWQKGFAWCSCFVRMIFIKSYPEKADSYKKMISPSTRMTYNNLMGFGYTCFQKPFVGALVLWATYRSGIQQPTGHAAIVTDVNEDGTFKTIEGNGSSSGSRNGDRVVEHTRSLKLTPNGLNILGFFKI